MASHLPPLFAGIIGLLSLFFGIVSKNALPQVSPTLSSSITYNEQTSVSRFFLASETKEDFYGFLMDKKAKRLYVYKIGEKVEPIKNFTYTIRSREDLKEGRKNPATLEGIYFFGDIPESECPPSEYGVRAFGIGYPNHFNQMEKVYGGGIWLIADDELDGRIDLKDSRSYIVAKRQDIEDISPYIELKKTPIIVVGEATHEDNEALIKARHDLKDFIQQWKSLWESENINEYMKRYSRKFISEEKDWRQWKRYKRNLSKLHSQIRVTVDNLVLMKYNSRAIAIFTQYYNSESYSDVGEKRLCLQREGRQWKIVGEQWTKREPVLARQEKEAITQIHSPVRSDSMAHKQTVEQKPVGKESAFVKGKINEEQGSVKEIVSPTEGKPDTGPRGKAHYVPPSMPPIEKPLPYSIFWVHNGVEQFHALVVEKKTQKLFLYKINKEISLIKIFYCSTGRENGDKKEQGDLRTPEGIYFFRDIKVGEDLPPDYGVKAFVMDYPNRFDQMEKKNGYGIWLHATDKPDRVLLPNDTKGCVVVSNEDIAELSQYIKLYMTPIVIVDEIASRGDEAFAEARKSIRTLIQTWKSNWENKELSEYMKLYSREFASDRMDWNRWRRHKKSMYTVHQWIQVEINGMRIIGHGSKALAMFTQNYKSGVYSDIGLKMLYLRQENGMWKIVGEEWKSSEKLLALEENKGDSAYGRK